MKINDFLSRLQQVTRNGTGWKAKCPAHEDKTPSLSIKRTSDGKILLKCFAGCTPESICTTLKITMSDLFEKSGKSERRIVAEYDYQGENGKLIYQVCRYEPKDFRQRKPDSTALDGWEWSTKAVRRVLYRLPELLAAVAKGRRVYICEGEKDVLTVVRAGFIATCNPGGAGKWQRSFSAYFKDTDVCVIADKDAPGRAHAQQVAASLHGVARCVRVLELPDIGDRPVKDAADFFAAGGQAADLDELTEAASVWKPPVKDEPPPTPGESLSRPLKVQPPGVPMDFKQWQSVISTNFPAYARPAEICASVVAQLLLNDVANPFALALVDVPASGKTITLNFFKVPQLSYATDSFTPASFVSHASNVKREELAKVDMLPRIRFRTLIVRDLAPIFGAKEDELLKTMGILTRALDGEGLQIDSGVHGARGYEGDFLFMLLAGTTPIPPKVFKVMGTLGSRLFFLALHSHTKSHDELMAQNRGAARQDKERACREATDSFLRTLWVANPGGVNWNKEGDPDECLRVIARCAELLAALRGAIQVWQADNDGSISHNVPVIEQPDRINCLLYNLARGHALICGRSQLTTADLAPVLELTFDSAPTIRSKVFRGLLEQGGALKTSQVERLLRCSKPTALKEMEALAVLGVADKTDADPEYGRPEHELRLAKKFAWFATAECKNLRWAEKQSQGGNP